jgi:hypothetical protein
MFDTTDWTTGVWSPAEEKDLSIRTSSEAPPASCTMGTGDHFPGGKERPARDANHTPSSSAEVKNKSYTSCRCSSWDINAFYTIKFGLHVK